MGLNVEAPDAVVVGLCAHGLAIARTLHRSGINVLALESDKSLPGLGTRSAKVAWIPDVNGETLPQALADLATWDPRSKRPVLFLTNDRMVSIISRSTDLVTVHYDLSWAECSNVLADFLRKENIETRCREVGMKYPKSRILQDLAKFEALTSDLQFPIIIKPCEPLSTFKTIVANNPKELTAALAEIATALPVLVQEFIHGDDSRIVFCALYLDAGKVQAQFVGRKLRSRPMGHTTLAIPENDAKVAALTANFFRGLELSGPLSLEMKYDQQGELWVIEPTVGRTDFWVGLCILNGVDIPCIEYASVRRKSISSSTQRNRYLWVNGERDPLALWWLLLNHPRKVFRRRLVSTYLDWEDGLPFVLAVSRSLRSVPRRVMAKVRRVLRRPQTTASFTI